ncbi:Mobile element protein [uncultured Candidatus Thioglobus sp.]|nr:Mobile element protein [uncultured Candidatus Thioglobus sp.]
MTHLTTAQRYTISCLLKQGKNQSEIAKSISKHKSVVCREISRNKDLRSGVYRDDLANRKHANRQKKKRKHVRFTPEIQVRVETLLIQDYSPEQIVGESRKRGVACVSHERIYQYVWKDKKAHGHLYTHLRRKGRKYRKRGCSKDSRGIIIGRVSIEQRPAHVEKRSRFGDLEVDLIIGKEHKQAIVTINDRASGMLKMKKVPSKNASVVSETIIEMLEDWNPFIHTITSDNGKEFAQHQRVSQTMNIDYYFAHPYHSWERGSNENLNGLIRQYLPKKIDFSQLTDQRIEQIQNRLNNRPRKRLKYESPIFVMNQLLFNPKVAFTT